MFKHPARIQRLKDALAIIFGRLPSDCHEIPILELWEKVKSETIAAQLREKEDLSLIGKRAKPGPKITWMGSDARAQEDFIRLMSSQEIEAILLGMGIERSILQSSSTLDVVIVKK